MIYTENLVPIMTSNTTPSGIASASSVYSGSSNYQPWKAFDGYISKSSHYESWVSNAVPTALTPQWIAYEFTSPQKVNKYVLMHGYNNINVAPKDWTFEGSNDGANWDVLDTRTDITDWTLWTKKEFTFENYNKYVKYRLNISANNGNIYYVGLQVFEMMSRLANIKYLIQDKTGTLLTLDTSGNIINSPSQTLDESNYLTNGFDNVLNSTQINQLKSMGSLSDYKLLMYTDNADAETATLNYNCDEYRPIDKCNDEFKILMYKEE